MSVYGYSPKISHHDRRTMKCSNNNDRHTDANFISWHNFLVVRYHLKSLNYSAVAVDGCGQRCCRKAHRETSVIQPFILAPETTAMRLMEYCLIHASMSLEYDACYSCMVAYSSTGAKAVTPAATAAAAKQTLAAGNS